MLIFATLAINIAAIAIWSAIKRRNGFVEVIKLLKGEPAFIPLTDFGPPATGEFGEIDGNRLGPPNPDIFEEHPQLRPRETPPDEQTSGPQ